jgi:hypothetical protein
MLSIQNDVFPEKKLAERRVNFSEYYSALGTKFIEELFSLLNPLDPKFTTVFLD